MSCEAAEVTSRQTSVSEGVHAVQALSTSTRRWLSGNAHIDEGFRLEEADLASALDAARSSSLAAKALASRMLPGMPGHEPAEKRNAASEQPRLWAER